MLKVRVVLTPLSHSIGWGGITSSPGDEGRLARETCTRLPHRPHTESLQTTCPCITRLHPPKMLTWASVQAGHRQTGSLAARPRRGGTGAPLGTFPRTLT